MDWQPPGGTFDFVVVERLYRPNGLARRVSGARPRIDLSGIEAPLFRPEGDINGTGERLSDRLRSALARAGSGQPSVARGGHLSTFTGVQTLRGERQQSATARRELSRSSL